MECSMLLHANTVVAKNVRMSVSIQTHVRCLMVMKAVLTMIIIIIIIIAFLSRLRS